MSVQISGDSTLTIKAYAPDGAQVGRDFILRVQSPSKTGLVNWMFDVLSNLMSGRNPVSRLTTRVVRSDFTSAGLSPVGVTLPPELLNKQPFYFAGQISGKGSSSASVSKLQSLYSGLMDQVQVLDNSSATTPSPLYKVTWLDSRTGVPQSKWRALVRQGSNATTAMTAQRGVLAGKPGSMVVRYKRSYDVRINSVACAGFHSLPVPTKFSVAGLTATLDSKALEKLHGKIYGINHDARIGESLAEYRQAMAMIGKPLDGFRRLIDVYRVRADEVVRNVARRVGRSLSRLDKHHLKEINAALASLYLEFTFGWKPLALDLIAAIKALEKERGKIATVLNASYTGDAIYSSENVEDLWNNYCYFSVNRVKRVRTTVRYKVGINPTHVTVLDYLNRIGVTPREFIPTMYAVLPYSWMLDYFTGINASIDALCSDLSFTTWTCKTVRSECVTETTANPNPAKAAQVLGSSFIDATGVPSVIRATMIAVDRSVPTTLIPVPSFRVPQSWKPWANIAALLVQRKVASGGLLASSLINDARFDAPF